MAMATETGTQTQGQQNAEGQQGEQQHVPTPAEVAAQRQTQQQQQQTQTQQQQQQQQQPGTPGRPEHPWDTPEAAKAEIERLRQENGDARLNAKNAAAEAAKREQLLQFAKILGIDVPGSEEGAPTIEGLSQQVQQTQQQAQQAKHDASLVQEAWAQGINPAKLDYLRYLLAKEQFDPSASDYGAKLKAAISSEVAKDSTLKLSGAGSALGGESFAGGDSKKPVTREQFDAMNMAERTTLYQTDKATYDRLVAER